MRSISRVCDVSINTVSKMLIDAGKACAAFHDEKVRGVKARRVQVDEIWTFTAAKQANVGGMKKPVENAGDTWTWTAIEADTKLLISWLVGGRDTEYGIAFLQDVKERLANRVQLSSDGHRAYFEAVEETFGADVDYAQVIKLFGASKTVLGRYSPPACIGARKDRITGSPDPARQHLLCRTAEPYDAYADAAIYAAYQCVLKEIREPHAHGRALHRLVQLREAAQEPKGYLACYGCRIE